MNSVNDRNRCKWDLGGGRKNEWNSEWIIIWLRRVEHLDQLADYCNRKNISPLGFTFTNTMFKMNKIWKPRAKYVSHFSHAVFLLDEAVIGWNRGGLLLTGNTQVSAYKSGCWLQFKGGIMFPHMAFIVILSLLLSDLLEWWVFVYFWIL